MMKVARLLAAVLALALAACGGRPAQTQATEPSAGGRVIDVIDIGPADFSAPTEVTNELHPVSEVAHIVMLGEDAGEPLRVEVTVLPETKSIDWNGGSTETVVSQYTAIVDGWLVEIAYDWYAQDDAGNVWYFGEDVFNYEQGRVADTEGTWIAGADGPPGLITPADPQVGDIYHPENIPELVFEEDVVVSVSETVDGPSGPVEGVMRVRETLMDGTAEDKYWAPGYGEYRAVAPDEDVSIVFALPNDAQDRPAPAELTGLVTAAGDAVGLAQRGEWDALSASVGTLTTGWDGYEQSAVPEAFVSAVGDALAELAAGAEGQDAGAAARAAVALELAALDVVMTHGELPDAQRLAALGRQLGLQAAAEDGPETANTVAVIAGVYARGAQTLGDQAAIVDALQTASEDGDFAALAAGAARLAATA